MTILAPSSEAELAEVIASSSKPFAIRGGGTRGLQTEGTPLSTTGLYGITLYEPGALTMVAQAGTPLAAIETALAAENQMLAFEPMDYRTLLGTTGEPTIGGVVAANVSGPRRVQAGACRDFLLGVRLVTGDGSIVKNGGRVMKNVTGYDLARLMCGARGTLGVLTEVALKVLPMPETETTLVIEDIPPNRAVGAMSKALATPFEISGAFFGPYHHRDPRRVCLRLEGTGDSVQYRADKLKPLLADFGSISHLSETESAQLWRDIRDMTFLSDASYVARSSIKPGAASEFIECIGQTLAATDYLDLGGGLVWTGATDEQLLENASQATGPEQRNNPDDGAAILHTTLQEYMRLENGHTTLVKSTEAVRQASRAFQPEAEPLARLAAGLRQKFDPKGILNPGLMG